MERLEGESLAERMSRGPVIVAEAIQIALGILAGLEVLHRKRLIHRDLKPANVFLTPHGTKLLDFGLSRAIYVSTTLREEGTFGPVTEAGMMVGSPNYMAPEQLVGTEVDGRADLFAVGAILFEMLTGRRAFGRTSTMEVFHAVLYEQPPALSGSAAISAVDLVARRALSKEPGQRYQTAHAMSDDLRAALLRCETAERVQARALTCAMVLPRARHSWLRPRRFWPALAGVAVLLAAGGLAWRAPWRTAAIPDPIDRCPAATEPVWRFIAELLRGRSHRRVDHQPGQNRLSPGHLPNLHAAIRGESQADTPDRQRVACGRGDRGIGGAFREPGADYGAIDRCAA